MSGGRVQMILCNNCGAALDTARETCGECGARNPIFTAPPAPYTQPPVPPVQRQTPGLSGGKLLLVLVGLLACFAGGALFATLLLIMGRPSNVQANVSYNSNYSANAGTDANINAYRNMNVYISNTNSNVGGNANVGSRSNMNAGNMNANSNRRTAASPFDNVEYKLLNNYYISESDVSGLSAYQLRLLRNTVFAKYGRVFSKDPDLQRYFDTKPWYAPNSNYTKSTDYVSLTAADEANLDVIKAAEAAYVNP